jgi:uncharacterized OB-fold protein
MAGEPPPDWALPQLDAANRPWFTAGALALQQCASCAAVQHPPEEICRACGSMTFTTRVVAPAGTVYSYTVARHAVNAALEGAVPYIVVLVRLDEVPEVRVVGNLLDTAPEDVTIGMAVETVWQDRVTEDGETVRLPQWRRRAIV